MRAALDDFSVEAFLRRAMTRLIGIGRTNAKAACHELVIPSQKRIWCSPSCVYRAYLGVRVYCRRLAMMSLLATQVVVGPSGSRRPPPVFCVALRTLDDHRHDARPGGRWCRLTISP